CRRCPAHASLCTSRPGRRFGHGPRGRPAASRSFRSALPAGSRAHHSCRIGHPTVRPSRDPCRVVPERLVRFPLRTILTVLGTTVAVAVVLEVIWVARHVIVWILISLFLALAMNPAVDWFQRHGIHRRGYAAGLTFLLVLAALAGLGALFIPTVVHQVSDLVGKVPDYVHDISHGKGRF